ncbi:N-acetyltransferase [Prevotella bivia]|uniref:N-acetyltransferase n=1 Tax=Prevotella bivia TaxID=28125 RepID=UPI00288AD4A7|nr:N-acetyltransferase [Prevotella bivia]
MEINFDAVNLELQQKSLLSEEEKKVLLSLWNGEYPIIISHSSLQSFNHYLDSLENVTHYLLMDLSHNIIKGWAFTFDRDNLRWFAIILSPTIQKKGIGRAMLKFLITKEKPLNAWVIDQDRYMKSNGQPYLSPLSFYLKLGCEVSKEEVSKSGNFSVVRIKFE